MKNQPLSLGNVHPFLVELTGTYNSLVFNIQMHPESPDFAASLAEMGLRSKVKVELCQSSGYSSVLPVW